MEIIPILLMYLENYRLRNLTWNLYKPSLNTAQPTSRCTMELRKIRLRWTHSFSLSHSVERYRKLQSKVPALYLHPSNLNTGYQRFRKHKCFILDYCFFLVSRSKLLMKSPILLYHLLNSSSVLSLGYSPL